MGTAEQVALVQAYADATVRLREALARAADATWMGLGSWREEDVPRFLDQLLPLVEGSVQAIVTMTDAYLTALLSDLLGGAPIGQGAAVAAYPRPRVSPEEVYRRPFVTTWTALSRGTLVSQAIEAGRARAVNLATTDLQLAKRDASTARLSADPRVVGFRRVLTGSKSCALCALAASQRYRKDRLLPVHPGCNCAVAPIVGTADPGQRVNTATVREGAAFELRTRADGKKLSPTVADGELDDVAGTDDLHEAIASRFGADAVDSRGASYHDLVVEHVHGELGPILARKGDRFTGPDDL